MERFTTPDTYAVWSKNCDTRYNSTSGGAFSEFAKVVLASGGLVAGAEYNSDNLVDHVLINHENEIDQLRQSKYMSSSLRNIYREVKTALEKGKTVAFCGAPCQVAGLYSFLGKEYDNLFTMDFICRGMNSPKAFKAWLNEIEQQEKSKVVKVWFKYKKGGWKSSPKRTRLDFENGTHKVFENEKNLYMHGYLTSNLYIRPSCGNCRFKGVPRKSDVTFADFWGIEKDLDDDKGTSMVLVNSEKGREYFKKACSNLNVYPKDFETVFAGNPMLTSSATVPAEGHQFLKDLDYMGFSDALKMNGGYPIPVPLWRRLTKKGKRLIKKIIRKD